MRISRHEIDNRELVRARFDNAEKNVAYYSEKCVATGRGFASLVDHALMAARNGSVLDGQSSSVTRALKLAAGASACMFANASSSIFLPSLDGHAVDRLEPTDESMLYHSSWIQGVFLNCLCRNSDNLEILCGVPADVLRNSSTRGPRFRELFADAMFAFWTDREDTVELLIEAMEKTNPDKYQLLKPDWVLHLDVPQIHLFSQVISENPECGAGLAKALELHKNYWSKPKDRRIDSMGFLPVNLLGLAALAYDRGIPFEIDSEYLPMYLVDGSFLKAS